MSAISAYLNITKPAVYPPETIIEGTDLTYCIQTDMINIRSAILAVGVALFVPVIAPFSSIGFSATYLAGKYLQTKYATQVLDKRAVEHILTREKTEAIAYGTMDYLTSHSSALQRLSSDERYTLEVLKMRDSKNNMLISELLKRPYLSNGVYNITITMGERLAKDGLNPDEFLEILESLSQRFHYDRTDFVFNAINEDYVKAADFTPEQVSQLWTHTSRICVLEADKRVGIILTQKGFDVNAVGDDGLTALERVLVNFDGNLKKLAFLLICGADQPNKNKKIIQEGSDSKLHEFTLEQVVKKLCQFHTLLASFLNYAEFSQSDLNPASSFLSDFKPAFWDYRKPAIQIDSRHRKFQANVILRSIAAAAIPFLVGVTVSLVTSSVVAIALPVIFSVGTLIATYHFESKRAHAELKKIALDNYKRQFPFAEVLKYILQDRDGNLLNALIEQGEDLRKFDSEGLSLWERALNAQGSFRTSLRVMRILADALFKNAEYHVTIQQYSELKSAISSGRRDIITYLISNKIDSDKLKDDQHFEFFLRCRDNIEMIGLLVDFGFNINARKENSLPILALAINDGMDYHFIERLLGRGANPDIRFDFRSSDGNTHENKTIEEWLDITNHPLKPQFECLLAKYR